MESNGSSPAMGLFVFWLMLQLVLMLALLVGGIYVLYCLGRAASGLDRLASAVETWVSRQPDGPGGGAAGGGAAGGGPGGGGQPVQSTGSLLRPGPPPPIAPTPGAPNSPYPPASPYPPQPPAPPAPPAPPGPPEGPSTNRPSF